MQDFPWVPYSKGDPKRVAEYVSQRLREKEQRQQQQQLPAIVFVVATLVAFLAAYICAAQYDIFNS